MDAQTRAVGSGERQPPVGEATVGEADLEGSSSSSSAPLVLAGAILSVAALTVGAAYAHRAWSRRRKAAATMPEEVQFQRACREGDLARVRRFLQRWGIPQGATASAGGAAQTRTPPKHHPLVMHDSEGWTPLHLAAINGDINLVSTLLHALRHLNWLDVNVRALQNRWSPLHVAAAKGNLALARLLIDTWSAEVDAKDGVNHTPLIIASCNGFQEVVEALLQAGADPTAKTSRSQESALHMAAKNGYTDILRTLTTACAQRFDDEGEPDAASNPLFFIDDNGSTLLHAATNSHRVAQGDLSCVHLILELTGDRLINEQKRDGSTALHVAAVRGNVEMINLLVSKAAQFDLRTNFGTTPLHEACSKGHIGAVRALLSHGAPTEARDNDGLAPLHTTCSSIGATPNRTETARLLLEHGADVNVKDSGNSTPLHALAYCSSVDDDVASCAQLLLSSGLSYAVENEIGWTPLHSASSTNGNIRCKEAILTYLEKHDPQFLASFDYQKPRGTPKRRSEVYKCALSESERQAVLDGDVSLRGIAKKILSGKIRRIIVMAGAGISVDAGIPDFRSPNTGIYSGKPMNSEGEEGGHVVNPHLEEAMQAIEELKAKYSLTSMGQVFTPAVFHSDPAPFWAVVRRLFFPKHGSYKPTATHWFIRLLQDKGLLLRLYSQNIDLLEEASGIAPENIVAAHGSLARAYCANPSCGQAVTNMKEQVWDVVERGDVPYCPACGGAIRPDVVFFGEPMPPRYFEKNFSDFKSCDLLIVMGTSLTVYPFAGLVNQVPATTPRLLLNKNSVGAWTALLEENGDDKDDETARSANYRDVQVLGSCDNGVQELIRELGWENDLAHLQQPSAPSQ